MFFTSSGITAHTNLKYGILYFCRLCHIVMSVIPLAWFSYTIAPLRLSCIALAFSMRSVRNSIYILMRSERRILYGYPGY